MVIIDAGPLVALFDRSEHLHRVCRAALEEVHSPLMTTWPALTEAFYFLKGWDVGQRELWDFIQSGGVRVADIPEELHPRMRDLMAKYSDLPMDFADASLVVLAEDLKIRTVFTLDKKDFSQYRPRHCKHFETIP
ncbi:MAG: hypothetical protein A2X56_07245 [Nitrospirae bacterium GWC2_57_13]|nr:MAG: hypothetical protein A2X56_07245 [Nitrospirae bacterium GWC2_57_13]OGW45310.1 MAG: hypothetical protein A2X57_01440 [Nitrospirae bacterium GWD2_57_8]HAR46776.1 PIN domain nuclease [Nitrospiraceae bacterium]HAS55557.1 PIN domain nuclease [Nitrospiraceae bacterium]